MSRYNFGDSSLYGVIGSDKPLRNVFMDLENEAGEMVFDSMSRDDYFSQTNIRIYANIALIEFGITIPEEMLLKVEAEIKEILKEKK